MARLPRLSVSGQPHLLLQRGHNGQPIALDEADRALYVELLRDAARAHAVAVHAWALLDNELLLLVTPRDAPGLSAAMQAVGRSYVSRFNRRHGRSGTVWEGRFRGTVLEPARWFLACLRHVELAPVRAGLALEAGAYAWSSAAHHLGRARDPLVSDHPLYWALGNTPFEREHAYARWLEQGAGTAEHATIDEAARKGWALGSDAFVASLAETIDRPLRPRARGRPRKTDASPI